MKFLRRWRSLSTTSINTFFSRAFSLKNHYWNGHVKVPVYDLILYQYILYLPNSFHRENSVGRKVFTFANHFYWGNENLVQVTGSENPHEVSTHSYTNSCFHLQPLLTKPKPFTGSVPESSYRPGYEQYASFVHKLC